MGSSVSEEPAASIFRVEGHSSNLRMEAVDSYKTFVASIKLKRM
jgi:hypothetical protein